MLAFRVVPADRAVSKDREKNRPMLILIFAFHLEHGLKLAVIQNLIVATKKEFYIKPKRIVNVTTKYF